MAVEIVRVYFRDLIGKSQYFDFLSEEKARSFALAVKAEKVEKLIYDGKELKVYPFPLFPMERKPS